MSLAQECKVRVPLGSGHGKKVIPPILFRFGHNVLDWTALLWNFLLVFQTFLGELYGITFIGVI